MIKINLAKASAVSVDVGSQSTASGGVANFSNSDVITKVALMLVLVVGLYGYEWYNISQKKARLRVLKKEEQKLLVEVDKYGPITAAVEDLSKERKKLSQQMVVIQKISEKRAFKLRSIVALQESIPNDTWIEEMKFNKQEINFKGFSRSPSSVQSIVAKLSNLDFVSEARNRELKMEKVGDSQVHQFDIGVKVK